MNVITFRLIELLPAASESQLLALLHLCSRAIRQEMEADAETTDVTSICM